jgi:hypothetical protein
MGKRKEHIFEDDIEKKHCSKCYKYLNLDMFSKRSVSWDKLDIYCRICSNIINKKNANKETAKIKKQINSKKCYDLIKKNAANNQIILDSYKYKTCIRCNENKNMTDFHTIKLNTCIKAICKMCESNDIKKYKNNYYRKNINNVNWKIVNALRSRLYNVLKNQNTKKNNSTMELTGCTMEELKIYLENQFQQGMTWENHGSWHIDHIKPCCSFDLTKEEEQKKCFHFTNLQPLWAEDNLSKGGKWDG